MSESTFSTDAGLPIFEKIFSQSFSPLFKTGWRMPSPHVSTYFHVFPCNSEIAFSALARGNNSTSRWIPAALKKKELHNRYPQILDKDLQAYTKDQIRETSVFEGVRLERLGAENQDRYCSSTLSLFSGRPKPLEKRDTNIAGDSVMSNTAE